MKSVKKIKGIFKNAKGETLMEGIASILVFTILVASVTMMIMISLRITHNATTDAMVRQLEAGAVLSGNADLLSELDGVDLIPDDGVVSIILTKGINTLTIEVPVDIYTAGDEEGEVISFIAFEPK